ncbi:uncharacterized protein LOC100575035 isoform X2 [Acyrthosiphon pisum]|uniref:DUF4806 domain-containing protein n=1 Tax=Acyrthosiphon pisum TaxID=7029 RepID=A0A8R2JWU6_ACYPI|nr:uncharacterized protein LOC100575035 isoform X2 [Acyrthosiphon pisum]
MWTVVVFQNDNTVAAVPTNWYKDGLCAWPKKAVKHKSDLIKNQTEPTRSEFDRFPARQLSSSPIESLIEAEEKAAKGMFFSDLSSAEENTTNDNVDRKKKLYKDVFTEKEKKQSQPSKKKRSLSPPPIFDDSFASTSKDQLPNICDDNIDSQVISSQASNTKISLFSTETDNIIDNNITLATGFEENMLFQSTPKPDASVQIQHSNSINDAAFVNFVKSSLINIKYDVKLLSYSIDSLKTIIQNIEMNTSHISDNNAQQCISNIQELKWPITNMTQLDDNEKLLTDALVKNNEVGLLARLVGKSISESVRRMMSRMFDDSFLQNYSFLGFKGKRKFSGLSCCLLLFDAIRKEKKFTATPDHEISTIVAKWLAQAPNRISKKKNNTLANNIL